MVLGLAIVNDTFSGPSATRIMARISMFVILVPAFAPLLGGYIVDYFGWRANFIFVTGVAALLWIFQYLKLPETLPAEKRQQGLSLKRVD